MRFLIGAVYFLLSTAAVSAGVAADGSGVAILGSQRGEGTTAYTLRVVEGKRPIIIALPNGATATLEVDGVVRERAGSSVVVGFQPLGHAAAVLALAGLSPRNRVVVRITGPQSNLQIEDSDATGLLAGIQQSGFYCGVFYAIIATVALFAIVGFFALRDPTIVWLIGWCVSLLGAEGSRDAWLPLGQATNGALVMGFSFVSSLLVVGFCASYLRLRSQAPRLYVAAISGTGVPILLALVYFVAFASPADALIQIVPDLCALGVLLTVAVLRSRAGYTPANLLIFGLSGITLVFAIRLFSEVSGNEFPFVNRWGLEFGLVFVILAVSVGMFVRSRFLVRERAKMVGELSAATYFALHDELTGLLNRRGLDARVESFGARSGTVLFIDVDALKSINDRGGHAAGDRALTLVARILREAVRSEDVVARVGGDEFVVFLSGYTDRAGVDATIARIAAAVSSMRPLGQDDPLRIGLSVGSATLDPGGDFAAVVADADAAAYRIKDEHHQTSLMLQRRAV